MFGEYSIKNKFELNTQLKFILSFFRVALSDTATPSDKALLLLTKVFKDSVSQSDFNKITFTKKLVDSILSVESPRFTFTKMLNDTVSQSDSNKKTFTKKLTDSINASESSNRKITLNKSDSVSITDLFKIGFLLDKYINDTLNVSDSGGKLYKNYYTEPNYWQSDYSEGATSF